MPTQDQVNNALLRELAHRKGEIKQLQKQVYMQTIGLQSVSTVAAQSRGMLKAIMEHPDCLFTTADAADLFEKAKALLVAPVQETANHVIRLTEDIAKANKLVEAQRNMIEQMEGEIKHKDMKIAQLEQKN